MPAGAWGTVIGLGFALILSSFTAALAHPGGAALTQAGALIEKGRFQEALALIEANPRPSDPQALFLKGLALSGLDRWAEAYKAFQKTLEIAPNVRPALRNAGIAAYNLDRHREAADLLGRYLAAKPDDELARLYLGRSLLKLKSYAKAAQVLGELGDLRRQDPRIDLDFAEALQRSGRKSDATRTLLQISSIEPNIIFRSAALLFQMEKYPESIERFRSIESRYPDRLAVGYNLALAYYRSGQLPAAETALNNLVRSGVRDADVFGLLADVYHGSNRVREAYDALQQAILCAPGEKQYYLDLLSLCIEMEDYEDGFKVAELALKQHPRAFELYAQRGILYSFRNQFKLAERDFRKALEMKPGDPGLSVGLAVALVSDDRLDEARSLLDVSVRRANHYLLWYLYADVLVRLGTAPGSPEEKAALAALDTALKLNPGHSDSRLARARLLKARGSVGEAVAELQQAIATNPENRACYYELYRIELARGNSEKAETLKAALDKLAKTEEQESWQHAVLRQQMSLHGESSLRYGKTNR